LRLLLKIRLTEEAIAAKYHEQKMRCPIHLSIGQEAPAVGVSLALKREDCVVSTHRCHAHYLAKGGNLHAMIAELYGKATGCARGKGGSMHLVDPSVGMMGSSAVLGGTVPLAIGLALSFQLRGEKRVAVAYLGDGATEQGAFHEALHFAAFRKLPVIFSVENNEYATLSHISARRMCDVPIEKFAETYLIGGGSEIDGTDLGAVYEHAKFAVDLAHSGGGPSLLVSRAYRWKEHVGPNEDDIPGGRDAEELHAWKAVDPIRRWHDALLGNGMLSLNEYDCMVADLNAEIEIAFAAAEADSFPESSELMEDV
jgi:pyruvate dehydrogenase E1 component alpha subunit